MQTREAPDFGGLHKNKNCAFPLSLRIQGKLGSIHSSFFCSTIFSFALLSTPKVKRTVKLCERKKRQAEESLQ